MHQPGESPRESTPRTAAAVTFCAALALLSAMHARPAHAQRIANQFDDAAAGAGVDASAVRVDEPAAGAPVAAVRGGYLLPFEIVSVHLLVVLVGAAYLARAKRRRTPRAIDVAASSVGPVVTARQAARSSASALVSGGGR
jgi:hypothetical protein